MFNLNVSTNIYKLWGHSPTPGPGLWIYARGGLCLPASVDSDPAELPEQKHPVVILIHSHTSLIIIDHHWSSLTISINPVSAVFLETWPLRISLEVRRIAALMFLRIVTVFTHLRMLYPWVCSEENSFQQNQTISVHRKVNQSAESAEHW